MITSAEKVKWKRHIGKSVINDSDGKTVRQNPQKKAAEQRGEKDKKKRT